MFSNWLWFFVCVPSEIILDKECGVELSNGYVIFNWNKNGAYSKNGGAFQNGGKFDMWTAGNNSSFNQKYFGMIFLVHFKISCNIKYIL